MDGDVSSCDAAAVASQEQGRESRPLDANGDFEAWVRPHLVVMRRVAARLAPGLDPEDVVQDALTRAWRRRSTFDAERGSPRSWLLAVVADQARKARVRSDRYRWLVSRHATEASRAEGRDLDLERSIARLAPRQREVIDFHYFVDLSVRETAEVLGIAEGTVKSTLSDARSRLRELLREEDGHA